MTELFEGIAKILSSDSSDLVDLAELVDMHPAEMFASADLTGVDLRGQGVDFLLGLRTKFSKAILSEEQRIKLESDQERTNPPGGGLLRRSKIIEIWRSKIERFIKDVEPKNRTKKSAKQISDTYDAWRDLSRRILEPFDKPEDMGLIEKLQLQYAGLSLRASVDYNSAAGEDHFELQKLLRVLATCGFIFSVRELEVLSKFGGGIIQSGRLFSVIPPGRCTVEMVCEYIGQFDGKKTHVEALAYELVLSGKPVPLPAIRRFVECGVGVKILCDMLQEHAVPLNGGGDSRDLGIVLAHTHKKMKDMQSIEQALMRSPGIKKRYLIEMLSDSRFNIKLWALQRLVGTSEPLGLIDISSLTFGLVQDSDAVSYAIAAQKFLTGSQHRVLVIALDRGVGFGTGYRYKFRSLWPEYFKDI